MPERRATTVALACLAALAIVTTGSRIGVDRFDEASNDVSSMMIGFAAAGAIVALGGAVLSRVRARASARDTKVDDPTGDDDVPVGADAAQLVLPGAIAALATWVLAGGAAADVSTASWPDALSDPYVLLLVLAVFCLTSGIVRGREFDALFARSGERAWSRWLLWPSLGAITATYLASEVHDVWVAMVLFVVAMLTIVGHALVMGQRDRPKVPGGRGAAPVGPLRTGVTRGPLLSAAAVALCLAVAGVVELF